MLQGGLPRSLLSTGEDLLVHGRMVQAAFLACTGITTFSVQTQCDCALYPVFRSRHRPDSSAQEKPHVDWP